MNYRLVTAAEKEANRKRRNQHKSAKKKFRRTAALLNGCLATGEFGWVHLMMLGPDASVAIEHGTSKERTKALEDWKISTALDGIMGDQSDRWLCNPPPEETPGPVTHEFVKSGRTWRRRKLIPFELW